MRSGSIPFSSTVESAIPLIIDALEIVIVVVVIIMRCIPSIRTLPNIVAKLFANEASSFPSIFETRPSLTLLL